MAARRVQLLQREHKHHAAFGRGIDDVFTRCADERGNGNRAADDDSDILLAIDHERRGARANARGHIERPRLFTSRHA